jgi:flagellar biosynthesis protein FlhB
MLGNNFDRNLPATRRRREQARAEGFVVQSRILATGVVLILLGATWNPLGGAIFDSVLSLSSHSLEDFNIAPSRDRAWPAMRSVLQSAATWGVVLWAGAVFAVAMQTRGWYSPGFVLPRGARISPLQNLKRILQFFPSRASGATLAAGMAAAIIWGAFAQLPLHASASTRSAAGAWADALQTATFQLGFVCLVYGSLDLFLRHRRREANLRMTPAEWEEEQRSAARGHS